MVRIVRGDYLIVPDAADLEKKKKEGIKKAIDRIREQKKLRKKGQKKNRRRIKRR